MKEVSMNRANAIAIIEKYIHQLKDAPPSDHSPETLKALLFLSQEILEGIEYNPRLSDRIEKKIEPNEHILVIGSCNNCDFEEPIGASFISRVSDCKPELRNIPKLYDDQLGACPKCHRERALLTNDRRVLIDPFNMQRCENCEAPISNLFIKQHPKTVLCSECPSVEEPIIVGKITFIMKGYQTRKYKDDIKGFGFTWRKRFWEAKGVSTEDADDLVDWCRSKGIRYERRST